MFRRVSLLRLVLPLVLLGAAAPASAQPPAPRFEDVTYVLPQYLNYRGASDAEFTAMVNAIRTRIGEGPYVKVGFCVYVWLSFDDWNVDVDDPAAVRARLQPVVDDIDAVIARARAHNVPIGLSILNAIRWYYDPVQLDAERVDRRNMAWYSDNTLASGWMTYSRYSRRFRRVEEAYLRELGKVLANRMARYPETVVAAAGDGEEELSSNKTPIDDPAHYDESSMLLADYSPFAVAEFRDWLRQGGLYAQGQPFAGQGYDLATRYAGDATPGDDTNGDGHTLNGDFGTRFTTWRLRYFDWDLIDEAATAIPQSIYDADGWRALAETAPDGFDPPRVWNRADPWWQLWHRFRETMLWRHNTEFAKWITTSVDPDTSATVPVDRWFSYQIPADYLYDSSPENPNLRLDASASPWWSADVRPYGSLGLTTFNGYIGNYLGQDYFARTLANVAPHVAATNQRWGLLEWHPSVPVAPPDSWIWDDEMGVIERYRPSLIAPFALDGGEPRVAFFDTGFETSLKRLVDRLKDGPAAIPIMSVDTPRSPATLRQPFAIAGWALDFGTIRGPGRGAGVDRVEVYATRAGSQNAVLLGTAGYGGARPDVGAVFGDQFAASAFSFVVRGLAPGSYDIEVRAHSRGVSTAAVQSQHLSLTIASLPLMAIDTVHDGDVLRQPFYVAGWALDFAAASGTGVDAVDVFAIPDTGPAIYLDPATRGVPRPDLGAVFGAAFSTAGYVKVVNGLAPGHYRLVVYARSTVSGTFMGRVVDITIASSELMWIDAPGNGAFVNGPFVVAGWALDLAAKTGSGVDLLDVWAQPIDGSPAIYLGRPATYTRPDVGAAFGAQFATAGYGLVVTQPLPPGDYLLIVYAHNTITHRFTNAKVVAITVGGG